MIRVVLRANTSFDLIILSQGGRFASVRLKGHLSLRFLLSQRFSSLVSTMGFKTARTCIFSYDDLALVVVGSAGCGNVLLHRSTYVLSSLLRQPTTLVTLTLKR